MSEKNENINRSDPETGEEKSSMNKEQSSRLPMLSGSKSEKEEADRPNGADHEAFSARPAPQPGGSPFNLKKLDEVVSTKAPGIRPERHKVHGQPGSFVDKAKKFEKFISSNPWVERGQSREPKPELPAPEPEPAIKKAAPAPEDSVAPSAEMADQPALTAPANEAETGRAAPSAIRAEAPAPFKAYKTDDSMKAFAASAWETGVKKTAPAGPRDKKVRAKVVTLGTGIVNVIDRSVKGGVGAGKAVAGAASSGVRAAVSTVEAGVKSTADHVKGVIAPATSKAEEKPANKRKSIFTEAAETATDVTEKVADSVLTVGSGIGKVAGYVAKGAIAAPVDIIRGVTGIVIGSLSCVSRQLIGSLKKPKGESQKKSD